jgi:PPOX class probable F420-dependent enzyme
MRTQKAAGRASGGHGYVAGVLLVAGLLTLGAGVWAVAAPGSFADYTGFQPYNEHFVHDIGAFQLGLGVTLLLALVWRDGPALALAGFLAANTAHAFNHWIDRDLGGHARDPWVFLALSLVLGVALVLRLRQLGGVLGEVATTSSAALAPFARQKTALLTTYRRDGTPVPTPLSVAVEADHAYVRSWETAGKAKRLRHTPQVELAPCTARGRVTGPALPALAQRLGGAEARHAAGLLGRKYPFLQGVVVPWGHRAMRYTTVHYRLTPAGPPPAAASDEVTESWWRPPGRAS